MILKNSMNANLCIGKKNEKDGLQIEKKIPTAP